MFEFALKCVVTRMVNVSCIILISIIEFVWVVLECLICSSKIRKNNDQIKKLILAFPDLELIGMVITNKSEN